PGVPYGLHPHFGPCRVIAFTRWALSTLSGDQAQRVYEKFLLAPSGAGSSSSGRPPRVDRARARTLAGPLPSSARESATGCHLLPSARPRGGARWAGRWPGRRGRERTDDVGPRG